MTAAAAVMTVEVQTIREAFEQHRRQYDRFAAWSNPYHVEMW